jgi:protein SCO1
MRKSGLNFRALLSLVMLVLVAGVVALFAIGGQSNEHAKREQALAHHFDAAAVLEPAEPAPALALHSYLGQPVNIDSYKGKVVLVTFLYTTCPDICPLITSDLRVALNEMGPAMASKVQIIAVSVDPRVDTPQSVAAFLARHEMTGRMQYLIGSAKELGRVWKAWGVGSEQDAEQPQFVNHTGIVYGITGSGKRLTVYAPEFKPAEIAHDVPLLAAR